VDSEEFAALAEGSGLVTRLGEWTVRRACASARALSPKGEPPIRVGVNLSLSQLRQPDLQSRMGEILEETGLPPEQLELGIAESAMTENVGLAAPVLKGLAALGIRVAIDDFGIGYSSLSHLKQLTVHRLKIDRSLVTALGRDRRGTALVRAIVRVAHTLGLGVVAKGVETREQVGLLRQLGCDEIQGFVASDAVPEGTLRALVARSYGF
jgi:EAL domain-containing protein (putative c-di-GMP-specific phosphodiesterase class I)